MEYRITRAQMYMEIAHVVAKRSTCMRLNVGAVLVHHGSIVSIGYNGAPPGEPHCDTTDCLSSGRSCGRTIHAERNALDRYHGDARDLDLYVTHSPCAVCYDYIYGTYKVERIFFGAEFRSVEHLQNDLFDMQLYRVMPSGLVVDWRTGERFNE